MSIDGCYKIPKHPCTFLCFGIEEQKEFDASMGGFQGLCGEIAVNSTLCAKFISPMVFLLYLVSVITKSDFSEYVTEYGFRARR